MKTLWQTQASGEHFRQSRLTHDPETADAHPSTKGAAVQSVPLDQGMHGSTNWSELDGSRLGLMKDYLQPAATFALALAIFSLPTASSQDFGQGKASFPLLPTSINQNFSEAKGTYRKVGGQGVGTEPVRVFVMNPECLVD